MNRPILPWLPWLGGLILAVPALLLSPYRLGVLALVLCYTVAALAQNLLSGYADVPSLGNVAFFATGAYVAGSLLSLAHAPPIVAIAGGILAAGMAGLVMGLPALRVGGMQLAVVTVAVVFVIQELMQQWDAVHAPQGVAATAPQWLLDERGLYLAAAAVATLAYLGVWNILRSRSGRAILAMSDNPYAAASVGVNIALYRLIAFVLSGLLTGLAGVVYLYWAQTVTPTTFTLDLSLAFLTMMILGGSRSLGGSFLGAVIIGLLPQILKVVPSEIGQLNLQQSTSGLYALLLLISLRIFPEGIWNAAASRRAKEPGREDTSAGQ